MSQLQRQKKWSDMDNGLRIDATGNVIIKEGLECLSQSIINILSTNKYSRPREKLGSTLASLLFEPVSSETADDMEQVMRSAIERHDNRIGSLNIKIEPNLSGNYYQITIRFKENGALDFQEIRTFLEAQE